MNVLFKGMLILIVLPMVNCSKPDFSTSSHEPNNTTPAKQPNGDGMAKPAVGSDGNPVNLDNKSLENKNGDGVVASPTPTPTATPTPTPTPTPPTQTSVTLKFTSDGVSDASYQCLWALDATDAASVPTFVGCNRLAGYTTGTATVILKSPTNTLRLFDFGWYGSTDWNSPKNVNKSYIDYRSTANKAAMGLHMYFKRTDVSGKSKLVGMIDDSADGGCAPSALHDFDDLGFTLEISTTNYKLENVASSCGYKP